MAGLHENILELQNERSLGFLYHVPKIHLASLQLTAIKQKYQSIFRLEDAEAIEMAKLTRGYPFAFQLLGYLTWNTHGKYTSVVDEYKLNLYDSVYQKIWSELSVKDKAVLKGIVETEDSSMRAIKETLHLSADEWSPYRQRLIRKGLVESPERGKLRFTLPLFDEFIRDQSINEL